jgi:flagellar hook-associated protein 2
MATTSATGSLASLGLTSGTISSSGIGSGLDVNGIVSQLVAAERAPDDKRLTTATANLATEVSALGQLKGAMSTFQNAVSGLQVANAFTPRTAVVSDSTVFTASATGSTATGNYSVLVTQLAQAAQLKSAAITGGATGVVGTGSLVVSMGGASFTVTIDGTNNTVTGIRDAINSAPGNPGISASILSGVDGAHLLLSGSATGAANAITVSESGGDGGLSQLTYDPVTKTGGLTSAAAAQDAIVSISGTTVNSASNTVTTAVDGLTLNLLKAQGVSGTPLTLTVANDSAAVQKQVTDFVAAYNGLADVIGKLGSYDATTGAAGPLLGDAMMAGIDSQLRSIVSAVIPGAKAPYTSLASLGITTDTNGDLQVNSSKLQAALTASPAVVSGIFSGKSGLASNLYHFLDQHLSSIGDMAARNNGITAQQKDLAAQQDALNARMAIIQSRYQTQFNVLDSMLTKMQSTASYLTQQLAAMNKTTG